MRTKLLTLLLCLLSSLPALAYDFQVNSIGYNITGDNTVEVTRYDYDGYRGSITIPAEVQYDGKTYSVTAIGQYAFSYSIYLTAITLPNSITSIGDKAFSECRLKEVTIPNSVTSIGDEAFFGCTYLASVTIPNSVTSIGKSAFSECRLKEVTIPNSVTSIGDEAFFGCTYLTSITLPNSITSIGNETFHSCTYLTSITLPNSITSIGDKAFSYCTHLTSITLPNSLTSIGKWAFYGCTGLTSITLPNSLTSIGERAFDGCTGLTSITLPNSLTSIGLYAFEDCTGLTEIYCEAMVPPTCDYGLLLLNYANCTLYVPAMAVEAYRTTVPWNKFVNIVGVDNNEVEVPEEPTWQTAVSIEEESTQALFVPYVWASSDEAVASVSQTGEVTAVAPGTCTVTFTCGDLVYSCVVTVSNKSTGRAEVSHMSPAVAYDLQGRRVSNPRRGIFIVNGQKQRLN